MSRADGERGSPSRHAVARRAARRRACARRARATRGSSTASAAQSPSRSRNRPTCRHIRSCDFATVGDRRAPSAGSIARSRDRVELDDLAARPAIAPAVVAHRPPGARAEHQPLEQRVAGQPVGAVHAGARDLAGGEQARRSTSARRDRSPRRPSRSAPPARPGSRSRARSRPARAARLRDQRKPLVHERRGRDAPATGRPARRCARVSRTMRARDAIARREIAGRIVARHERLAVAR